MGESLKKVIADNLKAYRSEKGWSLSRTAQETTVSKAMLGQLERQESSPTMATMWKIAKGFDLPLSALIEPGLLHSKKAGPTPDKLDDIFQYKILFPFDPKLGSEMFLLVLPAGKESYSNAHAKGVVEDIVVISGMLDIFIEGQWQSLKAGEVLRFDADQEHAYRNSTAENAVFHNIIHYR
ncbi:MAG: helix-turn-helix transcriptional regulator [Oceanospirillaceae bacterium]|nr:helix-turn-helix transcriptional regulator [Oceanospirillaceae bacterium]